MEEPLLETGRSWDSSSAFPYLESVIGFMIVMYFFETYLDLRQHKALKKPNLPATLKGVVSEEKFSKARAYSLDKSGFHFIHSAFNILEETAILWFGLLPWFWQRSQVLVEQLGFNPENEIIHTLAFLGATTLWTQVIELPFSLYSTFVIEARHGFNKQTLFLFFKDMVLGMLLMLALGPPIISAIIFMVQRGGPYLALYLWGFMLVLSLVMMAIYPILIAPLFNKFTPHDGAFLELELHCMNNTYCFDLKLTEGPLRSKIEKLAASLHFPLTKLFVIDGSTRSSHSNAYMYGFYNSKRIVLYDTLIQQDDMPVKSVVVFLSPSSSSFSGKFYTRPVSGSPECKEEEVVAVLAHELGHWKLSHTMYSFVAMQVLTLLQFGGYTVVRNSKDLFHSFGFSTQPVLIGLVLFQHTIMPLQHLVSFALNLVSRAFEFQADAFASKLGYTDSLRGGLIKLQEENLSAMNTDRWYSAYHYSHPPLVERLQALDKMSKKVE